MDNSDGRCKHKVPWATVVVCRSRCCRRHRGGPREEMNYFLTIQGRFLVSSSHQNVDRGARVLRCAQ